MELVSLLAEYSRDLRPNGGTLLGVISPLLGELDPLRVGLGGLGVRVRVRVRDDPLDVGLGGEQQESPQPTHDGQHTRRGIPQPPCWAQAPLELARYARSGPLPCVTAMCGRGGGTSASISRPAFWAAAGAHQPQACPGRRGPHPWRPRARVVEGLRVPPRRWHQRVASACHRRLPPTALRQRAGRPPGGAQAQRKC